MLEQLSLSFVYRVLKDGLGLLRRGHRRLEPSEVIQIRQRWKKEFETKIFERRRDGLRTDVIIRDMKRVDSYPNINEKKKGISPWFRVGLMGTYHKGIQVGLGWGMLSIDGETKEWRYTDYSAGEEGDIKVILIGYIAFENIETVDWEGDEYYGFPHIYCYFNSKRKEPYERLAYCEQRELDDIRYYREIADHARVRKMSKKRRIEYFA